MTGRTFSFSLSSFDFTQTWFLALIPEIRKKFRFLIVKKKECYDDVDEVEVVPIPTHLQNDHKRSHQTNNDEMFTEEKIICICGEKLDITFVNFFSIVCTSEIMLSFQLL